MRTTDEATMLAHLVDRVEKLFQQNEQLRAELLEIKQTLRQGNIHTGQVWLKSRPAAAALACQGIANNQALRRLVGIGVLRVGEEARNVGTELQPRWEFNIPKCERAIERYKALSPEMRDRLYQSA